jgi:hypothetical protein
MFGYRLDREIEREIFRVALLIATVMPGNVSPTRITCRLGKLAQIITVNRAGR